MKVFIDDTREAPEGWHLIRDGIQALHFIEAHNAEIEAISFDFYLEFNKPIPNCGKLIRHLGEIHFFEETPIFKAERKFKFHSSDNDMNRLMHKAVKLAITGQEDEFFDLLKPYR